MISSSTTLTQQNKCGTAGGHSYVGKLKLTSDRRRSNFNNNNNMAMNEI
jgi:hypothetical protein